MSEKRLAEIFKYSIVIQEAKLPPIVAKLLSPDATFPSGSSFAVTVADGWPSDRKLWMSESSMVRVKEMLREAVL